MQRLTGAAQDLSTTGVKVPAPLSSVVRKLLQRDPERRYQSAREVLDDLARTMFATARWKNPSLASRM